MEPGRHSPDGARFDARYYAQSCGRPYGRDPEWLRFFGTIADRIVADIAPRRVLDAGCAMGLLVEALRERGIVRHLTRFEPEGADLFDAAERVALGLLAGEEEA